MGKMPATSALFFIMYNISMKQTWKETVIYVECSALIKIIAVIMSFEWKDTSKNLIKKTK